LVTLDNDIGLNKAAGMKSDGLPDCIFANTLTGHELLIELTISFFSKLLKKFESNWGVTLRELLTELDPDSFSPPSEQEGEHSIKTKKQDQEKKKKKKKKRKQITIRKMMTKMALFLLRL